MQPIARRLGGHKLVKHADFARAKTGILHYSHFAETSPKVPRHRQQITPTPVIQRSPNRQQLIDRLVILIGRDVTTAARFSLLARVFLIRFESCRVYLSHPTNFRLPASSRMEISVFRHASFDETPKVLGIFDFWVFA
jgi:hypothetical protein